MQKGTLIVMEGNNGKFFKLKRDKDKTNPVVASQFSNADCITKLDVGELEVEYELNKIGHVSKLIVNGETLELLPRKTVIQDSSNDRNRSRQNRGRGGGHQQRQHYAQGGGHQQRQHHGQGGGQQQRSSLDGAFAPYNFVPLNQEVLAADTPPHFDVYDGLSGYIELDIEAKSPLFIRGTLTQEEVERNVESKDKEDHYKPARQIRLPGSSIRGMVRSLYEIVSYSKLGFIDDRKLFFRSFADISEEFRELYSSTMIDSSNPSEGYRPKVLAGYLTKRGREYRIVEACSYHRVEEELVINKEVYDIPMRTFTPRGYRNNRNYTRDIKRNPFKKVVYTADNPDTHHHSDGKNLYYSKVTDIKNHQDTGRVPEGFQAGYLVLSGWIPGENLGKHMHWVIGEPSTGHEYQVPKKLVDDYEKDTNRNAINLLNAPDTPWGKPCFFTLDGRVVKAFGHTGMFRNVYDNKIGDLRPQSHLDTDLLDMTEALFGKVGESDDATRPGRVYFEDAAATRATELETAHPKILSGPKPNSFQLYLKQNVADIRVTGRNRTGIKNYDTDGAQLAGRKLYWHRDHNDWMETDEDRIQKYHTQYTRIKPIKQGAKFKARIRFDNLSDIELGALLFVLDLPQGCCHKIGMGKPLGLGSIRITPTLTLIDRKERYSSLKELGIPKETDQKPDPEKYKDAFEDHLRKKDVITGSAWDSPELKELKVMLDYDNRPSLNRTRYMEIERRVPGQHRTVNEYRDRKILRKPSEYPTR